MKLFEYKGGNREDFLFGQVGIEIETETEREYLTPTSLRSHWAVHPDGSLRHFGQEYVLARPRDIGSKEYNEALAAFDALSKQVRFLESPYTSVHVHLNMLDKDLIHMMNFIALYFLFEEVLGEYCGNSRNGNLFCLKTSTAEETYRRVVELATAIENGTGLESIRNLNNDVLKYSGLNIVPLRTQGSIEVRTHPGTVDVALVDRWVRILNQLYVKADTFLSPVEILERLVGSQSKREFARRIFEDFTQYLNVNDLDRMMHDGIWYSAALGRAVKNWKDFGTRKSARSKPKKWNLETDATPATPARENLAGQVHDEIRLTEEQYRRMVEELARPRTIPTPNPRTVALGGNRTLNIPTTTNGFNWNWVRTTEDT